MEPQSQCLFCRISSKQLPADILWEDENVVVFNDIHPQAPTHLLVIPRQHIQSLADVEETNAETMGQLMVAVAKSAIMAGLTDQGWRTIINTRHHGGQEVDHLHIHILGGEPLGPMRCKHI